MQIQAKDVNRHLSNHALPQIILVFGDEPQQKLDVIDAIRQKAKQSGFDERQNFTLDSDFSWSALIDAMQSMSLFADKQYIELSMPSAKPGTAGAKQFVEIANMDNPDVVLLIHGPKAGKDVQNTKWFKALASKGWVSIVYDLSHNQLYTWLSVRAREMSLNISNSALSMITDLCEGNVMAGRQELEKLALQFEAQHTIDEHDIASAMVQQSRYSVFQFTDEVLSGNITKAIKILGQLEDEGIEPVVVLWSLVNEAQTLSKLIEMKHQGTNINYKSLRIWPSKQHLYQQAIARINQSSIVHLNAQLSAADVMFKSQYVAKPYVMLSHLALLFLPSDLQGFNIANG